MSQVIAFPAGRLARPRPDEALVLAIVNNRWPQDSVYWLKECAEILSVMEETGAKASPALQAALAPVLDDLPRRLAFFPQYYRFFLAIALSAAALDLMPRARAVRMAEWVLDQGWPQSELSDANRAEAGWLMQRAGLELPADPAMNDRLRRFMERGATFAIPNRKAAYELTHLVFYLSDQGRQNPHLSKAAVASLRHAGTLAWLEQNADLLAEICLCLAHAGQNPPEIWLNFIVDAAKGFAFEAKHGMVASDDLHCLLVCNWFLGRAGHPAFRDRLPDLGPGKTLTVRGERPAALPLRELSTCLLGLGDTRAADWDRMRDIVTGALTAPSRDIVLQAEAADQGFEAFFAAFARAGRVMAG
ncbi:DUF6902 family protein [Neogemmobacter tilapiae]|uniref:Uncharacterized protein n=1 Tax=Neogemmobacter tilapiae TaxID=875041 RepID=A0A918TH22_9RHOB|nr:hypothetical protein [Gemmobacter tilapiae]GHC46073.1 hypothetical protein GCM10007315_04620 [Gemmobacter tilapiae]